MNPQTCDSRECGAAVCGYVIAAILEATVIRTMRRPSGSCVGERRCACVALGVAVYLWRHCSSLAASWRSANVPSSCADETVNRAQIQRRLLPLFADDHGCRRAAALRSAGKIGGDLYDFVATAPSIWVVLVADVSGKGIPAAMVLGSLRSAFRAFARQSADPARIVAQLSTVLYEEWCGSPYVTGLVATFDLTARTVTYTNAGHPPGSVAGRHGMHHLSRGGPPAVSCRRAVRSGPATGCSVGDVCLLVTDGGPRRWRGTHRSSVLSRRRRTFTAPGLPQRSVRR